jgi:hypothetical protein
MEMNKILDGLVNFEVKIEDEDKALLLFVHYLDFFSILRIPRFMIMKSLSPWRKLKRR